MGQGRVWVINNIRYLDKHNELHQQSFYSMDWEIAHESGGPRGQTCSPSYPEEKKRCSNWFGIFDLAHWLTPRCRHTDQPHRHRSFGILPRGTSYGLTKLPLPLIEYNCWCIKIWILSSSRRILSVSFDRASSSAITTCALAPCSSSLIERSTIASIILPASEPPFKPIFLTWWVQSFSPDRLLCYKSKQILEQFGLSNKPTGASWTWYIPILAPETWVSTFLLTSCCLAYSS